MASKNLILYVASYDDASAAEADYKALKSAQVAGEFVLVGSVVASRDEDGEITVDEHGIASPVAGGTTLGAVGGLAVGLFAPPLLLATAIGAGLGAGIAELKKRHDEKELGVEVEEYLPKGSSAIIVVADDVYLDHIETALEKSIKKVSKAIDSGDYEKLEKELEAADDRVTKAVEG